MGLRAANAPLTVNALVSDKKSQILLEAAMGRVLVATGFALSLATAWGFLEQFDLVAHIPAYYWAIIWFAGLGVGALYNRLTLSDAGCAP